MAVSEDDDTPMTRKVVHMFRVANTLIESVNQITFCTHEAKAVGYPHLGVRVGLHCGRTFTGITGNTAYPKYKFFGARMPDR
eukprot:1195802-Prorocentrum_minimum.AAC.4